MLSELPANTGTLVGNVARTALPLNNLTDLDPLLRHIGSARYVLLGEAPLISNMISIFY